MSAHLSRQMVERYRQHLMTPAELLDTDDHTGACKSCRQLLFNAEQLHGKTSSLHLILNSLPDIIPEHPGYPELAAYIDDQLKVADREIVESHVEGCRECAAQLYDLLTFKISLADNIRELPPL